MQQRHEYSRQDEEIELIDLIRVVSRRRSLILTGTLLATLLGVAGGFLIPTVYEVSAVLQPGKKRITNENGLALEEKSLVSPEAVKEKVHGGVFDQQIRDRLNISLEEYPKVTVLIPQNAGIARLVIESGSPERALAVMREMISMVSAEIDDKLEAEKNLIKDEVRLAQLREDDLTEKLRIAEQQIAGTRGKIEELWKERRSMARDSSDAIPVLLYTNEIQNHQVYLNNLQERVGTIHLQLQDASTLVKRLQSKMTSLEGSQVKQPPTVSERPAKPKKPLLIVLSSMFGLMATTVTSFFLEYLERHRSEISRKHSIPVPVANEAEEA